MHTRSPNRPADAQLSLNTNYRKTILSNGIRLVTEEIPYVRSVSVGVWVNAGSRDEHSSNNGISHFLEHMVFKGTKRYSAQQIARSLEKVGGYLNAFTTKEQTCFYARVLDAHLTEAVDVISDLVQYPVFRSKDVEKEKLVVLEEMKNIEDDPDDLIHDYVDQAVYADHPLGFPIIGTAENVRAFSGKLAEEYLHAHYISGQIVVAAAGNVKHERLAELVEKLFGTQRRSSHRPRRVSGPRKARAIQRVYEKPINQAHICLGTLGYSVKDSSRYPLLVLNTLLGEGMSSRLFQNIREKYGFAYNVYSFANLMSDTGNFGAYIATDKNKVDESIALIHREFEKVASKPVSSAELKRAKAQLKGSMMLSLESMSNRMMRLGSGEIFFGEHIPLDEILRKIESIAAEDVVQVAKDLLPTENFSTIVITPSSRAAA